MLSNYYSHIPDKHETKIDGINKLVSNLCNKSKYIVHYKNLQLCLSLGMKLNKIHKISKFEQTDWSKNTLILIQTKENMLLKVLKIFFLNMRIIEFLVKQWKI